MRKFAHSLRKNEREKRPKIADFLRESSHIFYTKTKEKNGGKSPILAGITSSSRTKFILKDVDV